MARDDADPIPHARESAADNPLEQFLRRAPTTALGHFERLVNAIQNQDRCVLADDWLGMETWKRIAACASMNLAREHADKVRTALETIAPNPSGDEVAELRAERDDYRTKRDALRAEFTRLNEDFSTLRDRATAAEAKLDALQAENAGLRRALTAVLNSMTKRPVGAGDGETYTLSFPPSDVLNAARAALSPQQQSSKASTT